MGLLYSSFTMGGVRKNYLPVLFMLVFWWLVVGAMVWWIDPMVVADVPIESAYLIPATLIWLSSWYTLSLVLGAKKRGAVVASGLVVYLYFRLWGVDMWWNVGLLVIITGLIYRFVVDRYKSIG